MEKGGTHVILLTTKILPKAGKGRRERQKKKMRGKEKNQNHV